MQIGGFDCVLKQNKMATAAISLRRKMSAIFSANSYRHYDAQGNARHVSQLQMRSINRRCYQSINHITISQTADEKSSDEDEEFPRPRRLLPLVLLQGVISLFTVGMIFDLHIRNNPLIIHKHQP